MNGIGYTIELDSAELDAMIARAINEAHDMRRPMGEIAGEWLDHVHERFDQEKDPQGVPWAKRHDNVDPDRKVLHLTGALENQIVPDFGSDYAQVGLLPSGGPGKYGRIHNEGGVIRPKEKAALSFGGRVVAQVVMPKRQFLGFGPAEQETVEDVMGNWLRGLFGVSAA